MTEYYAALLEAEATILGIFLAGAFIYTQIVADRFSHRLARSIVGSRLLLAFVTLSASCLLLTSLALFLPAQTDKRLRLEPIFESTAYSGANLGLFVTTLVLFALTLAHLSRYLSPAVVLGAARKTFRHDEFSDFLDRRFEARVRGQEAENAGLASDPLLPIIDLAASGIAAHDRSTFSLATETLVALTHDFVQQGHNGQPTPKDAQHFARLIAEHLESLVETCHAAGHPSLVEDVAITWREILLQFSPRDGYGAATNILLDLGQDLAEASIEQQRPAHLHQVTLALGDVGVEFIKRKDTDLFDNTCRILGHLGELAAMKSQRQETLLSALVSRTPNEINSIVQALDQLNYPLIQNNFDPDPLIYRDALFVFSKKLIECATDPEPVESPLISLGIFLAEMAKEGATSGNERPVYLVLHNLESLFTLASQKKWPASEKQWREYDSDIVDWAIEIGVCCGLHNKQLEDSRAPVTGTPRDMIQLAVESLVELKHAPHMEGGVKHAYFKSGHRDGVREFVNRLGAALGTSFGLSFELS